MIPLILIPTPSATMSDLELTDPYDADAFERSGGTPAAPAVPPPARREDALPAAAAPSPSPPPEGGPVPWKGVASSVPRLRQQPVSYQPSEAASEFQGFAQDALPGRGGAMFGEHPERDAEPNPEPGPSAPLAVELPFWELWLERARMLPPPLLLGVIGGVVAVVVLAATLRPREQASVSLAAIRQNPEAYDGRMVAVRGTAGEAFALGGNYVFNLRQGRDTIVVYSRTRNPALNEKVKATGTVSIGYLDGVPRVALLEQPPSP